MSSVDRIPQTKDASRRLVVARPAVQLVCVGVIALSGAAMLAGMFSADDGGLGARAAAAFALGLALALLALRRGYPHDAIGWCNAVTVVRLMLTSILVALVFAPSADPWATFVLACLAFGLDGVDGWLARREGRVSKFGALFDMEVDAALAMSLAVLAWQDGSVGVHVLGLGVAHYAFLFASLPLPWLGGDLPPRFSRKAVCVFQIATLIFVLVPEIRPPLSDIVVAIAFVMVTWSFWRDIRWLRRMRA